MNKFHCSKFYSNLARNSFYILHRLLKPFIKRRLFVFVPVNTLSSANVCEFSLKSLSPEGIRLSTKPFLLKTQVSTLIAHGVPSFSQPIREDVIFDVCYPYKTRVLFAVRHCQRLSLIRINRKKS